MSRDKREYTDLERVSLSETLLDILPIGIGSGDNIEKRFAVGRWKSILKYLRDEYQIDTDILGLVENAHCLAEIMIAGVLAREGVIKEDTFRTFREIVERLMPIAIQADKGEERAINRLKVIHKFAYPDEYEVPTAVISELADKYHTSPHLARAWAIRKLMIDLSFVVKPMRRDKNPLQSAVRLREGKKEPILEGYRELYQRAAKHIKRNTTLQSLAMSIYLEDLEAEGISLETRQLKLDLQKLRQWEKTNKLPLLPIFEGASLPVVPMYSEGWKSKYRRGDKK